MEDIYVVGKKMARNGHKIAICKSTFLCIRVYHSAIAAAAHPLTEIKWQ